MDIRKSSNKDDLYSEPKVFPLQNIRYMKSTINISLKRGVADLLVQRLSPDEVNKPQPLVMKSVISSVHVLPMKPRLTNMWTAVPSFYLLVRTRASMIIIYVIDGEAQAQVKFYRKSDRRWNRICVCIPGHRAGHPNLYVLNTGWAFILRITVTAATFNKKDKQIREIKSPLAISTRKYSEFSARMQTK